MKMLVSTLLLSLVATAELSAQANQNRRDQPAPQQRRGNADQRGTRRAEANQVEKKVGQDAEKVKQGGAEAGRPAPRNLPANATTQTKKQWLFDRVIRPTNNPQAIQLYSAQLARMTPQQVDALVRYYQALHAQQAQQGVNAAQRQAAIQRYRQRMAQRNNAVGFAPIITWLPSGTNFNAGAVVSPDGRNVRMSLNPVFSSVPSYDTFNFSNGQTRRYYVDQVPPGANAPRRQPTTPTRPTPSWYRRVRTR